MRHLWQSSRTKRGSVLIVAVWLCFNIHGHIDTQPPNLKFIEVHHSYCIGLLMYSERVALRCEDEHLCFSVCAGGGYPFRFHGFQGPTSRGPRCRKGSRGAGGGEVAEAAGNSVGGRGTLAAKHSASDLNLWKGSLQLPLSGWVDLSLEDHLAVGTASRNNSRFVQRFVCTSWVMKLFFQHLKYTLHSCFCHFIPSLNQNTLM